LIKKKNCIAVAWLQAFFSSTLMCSLFYFIWSVFFQTYLFLLAVMDLVKGNRLTTSFLTFTNIEAYMICVIIRSHS